MAFEYKGTLIKDPITGKLRYDNPQALPTSAGAGYMLPKQEQKIVRDSSGLPTMQTTSPYPIHQQPALKMHPMTTPEAAGFSALPPAGISQEVMPQASSGYFGYANSGETQKTKFTPNQSGIATGAFAINEQKRLENVEAEKQRVADFWRGVNDSRARDTADIQNSNAMRLQSAIASGDYRQADALTKALQASSGIHPLDMSNQANADIKRSMAPAQNKLAEAQAELFRQQATTLPYKTAMERYAIEHAAKNQPQDFNSKIAALVKSGVDMDEAMALAGIPDNATPEQRQQAIAKIRASKKG